LDQNIIYSIICKNTDNFKEIEKRFYEKYPEYRNTKNYFIVNGKEIDKTKNLDENKIKNSDIITIKSVK
jgi:CRISPR/Cas system-associated protein endoribonuclease Cas2